jgi:hypothetical protein
MLEFFDRLLLLLGLVGGYLTRHELIAALSSMGLQGWAQLAIVAVVVLFALREEGRLRSILRGVWRPKPNGAKPR